MPPGPDVADRLRWLSADWPAPPTVRALTTLRAGGASIGPYASLNLGDHVGDRPAAVAANRARLRDRLALPAEPLWLRQVHGNAVVEHGRVRAGTEADGAVALAPGRVCAVLTADCLPVLLCDRAGTRVAALHAGWRGLVAGILEAGVARLGAPGGELLAWLGPAIGPQAFEVGPEVVEAFAGPDPGAVAGFRPGGGDRWLADIFWLARRRLERLGASVSGGGRCTVENQADYFSYRRDRICGRMASLIWLAE